MKTSWRQITFFQKRKENKIKKRGNKKFENVVCRSA